MITSPRTYTTLAQHRTMDNLQPELGELIRELRLDSGLSQERFAEESGIDQRTLSKIEKGEAGFRQDSVAKIARFFKKPIGVLLNLARDRKFEPRNATDQRDYYHNQVAIKLDGVAPKGSKIVDCNTKLAILRYLLAHQLPWGEWADRRNFVESEAAERKFLRVLEGPKPNVARTLFAINALQPYERFADVSQATRQAKNWMGESSDTGWFLEWRRVQTSDSEESIPQIEKLPDIRHTAQVISALHDYVPYTIQVQQMVKNILNMQLTKVFWPETVGTQSPKILSTVYVIEALGRILSCKAINLLNRGAVRSAFFAGLDVLQLEVRQGGGLIGSNFGGRSSYLTGMALYRLAPLSEFFDEVGDLASEMVLGLENSQTINGWEDESLPRHLRTRTNARTGLRVLTGLKRFNRLNSAPQPIVGIASIILKEALENIDNIDAPDLACLLESAGFDSSDAVGWNDVEIWDNETRHLRAQIYGRTHDLLSTYLSDIGSGELQIFSCFQQIAQEFRDRLFRLEGEYNEETRGA